MSYKLHPYISFQGRAREAMTFYQQVFGGQLDIVTFGQMNMPGAPADAIMHAALVVEGTPLVMGSDAMEEAPAGIALSLGGTSSDLHDAFSKLAVGATGVREIQVEQWGDEYGELVDQFGVRWMFNGDSNEAS